MKWLVEFVPRSKGTQKRIGKARTEMFHTDGLTPDEAEAAFERQYQRNPLQRDFAEVIDIRPADRERPRP